MISKGKLDMPKAVCGLLTLLGESARQECAVGAGGGGVVLIAKLDGSSL